MFDNTNSPSSNGLADKLKSSGEHAISATHDAATGALDSLADSVLAIRAQAEPALARASGQANALLQNGMDSVRNASSQLTEAARQARDGTVAYVKDEPVKSMLIAAATGAALMALVSMMGSSRRQG